MKIEITIKHNPGHIHEYEATATVQGRRAYGDGKTPEEAEQGLVIYISNLLRKRDDIIKTIEIDDPEDGGMDEDEAAQREEDEERDRNLAEAEEELRSGHG